MGGRALVVAVCLGMCACGASSRPTVRGQVLDRDSGNSIEGVKVLVKGERASYVTITDRSGIYELSVPPGVYEVWFAYRESVTSKRQVRIDDAGVTIYGLLNVPAVWNRRRVTHVGREQGDPMFWFRTRDGSFRDEEKRRERERQEASPEATEPAPAAR